MSIHTKAIGINSNAKVLKSKATSHAITGAFNAGFVNSILSYEVSAMVMDQTHELRTYTEALEKKSTHDSTHIC